MRVVVAHPGQQHSFKVAAALKEKGNLLQFITAVYDKPNVFSMKIAHQLVKGADSIKILKRKTETLEDSDVTVYYTFLSLAVIILSRNIKTKPIAFRIDRWISRRFGLKVAKYAIKHNADAVICFSRNEESCFEYLSKHAPNIARIVDCANSPVTYMKKIYDKDMHDFSHSNLIKEAPHYWDEKTIQEQIEGIKLTQYFLAPSSFVKKGLMFSNASEDAIHVLHYGANFQIGIPQQKIPENVKFIYVGQVTYRKGMHHLLNVFSKIENADLTIVGWYNPESDLYNRYKEQPNIHFMGKVMHEKVEELLKQSNVFVFDSLTEGFSLACLEAMSCGLPIVCSKNSGINDLVIDGINGFSIDYYDEKGFEKAVRFFMDNPQQVPEMSVHAIESAIGCQWSNYNKELNEILETINTINMSRN